MADGQILRNLQYQWNGRKIRYLDTKASQYHLLAQLWTYLLSKMFRDVGSDSSSSKLPMFVPMFHHTWAIF